MCEITTGKPSLMRRLLEWRPLVWTGTISYGLYLWHYPLMTLLRRAADGLPYSSIVARAAVVPAAFVLAVLSYRFIEVPARRRWRDEADRRFSWWSEPASIR